jgi:hypothetical protein
MSVLVFFAALFVPWQKVHASLLINEAGTHSSPDWVEIINTGTASASLVGYQIRDSAANSIDLSGDIAGGEIKAFDFSNRLDNDGDTVKLVKVGESVSVDELSYGPNATICAPVDESQSVGSKPDGSGTIVRFASSSKAQSNNSSATSSCPAATSTPTPTTAGQSPTPTNTGTPTPTITNTPTPSTLATKTPTSTPKKTPTPTVDDLTPTATPDPFLAGTSDDPTGTPMPETPTPTPVMVNRRSTMPIIIAMLMVAAGLAIMSFVLVWNKTITRATFTNLFKRTPKV